MSPGLGTSTMRYAIANVTIGSTISTATAAYSPRRSHFQLICPRKLGFGERGGPPGGPPPPGGRRGGAGGGCVGGGGRSSGALSAPRRGRRRLLRRWRAIQRRLDDVDRITQMRRCGGPHRGQNRRQPVVGRNSLGPAPRRPVLATLWARPDTISRAPRADIIG